MRSITEQTYVDEIEMDEEGIAELFMDDNVLADVASKLLLLLKVCCDDDPLPFQ